MKRWQKVTVFTCIFVMIARLGLVGYALSPCDFNDDGVCDATDIHALLDQGDLIQGVVPNDPRFDLTGDGLANIGDLHQWFREAVDYDAPANHFGGDANLDGTVNRIDLNLLGLNWQGTDKVWSEGDFTGDGQVVVAKMRANESEIPSGSFSRFDSPPNPRPRELALGRKRFHCPIDQAPPRWNFCQRKRPATHESASAASTESSSLFAAFFLERIPLTYFDAVSLRCRCRTQ